MSAWVIINSARVFQAPDFLNIAPSLSHVFNGFSPDTGPQGHEGFDFVTFANIWHTCYLVTNNKLLSNTKKRLTKTGARFKPVSFVWCKCRYSSVSPPKVKTTLFISHVSNQKAELHKSKYFSSFELAFQLNKTLSEQLGTRFISQIIRFVLKYVFHPLLRAVDAFSVFRGRKNIYRGSFFLEKLIRAIFNHLQEFWLDQQLSATHTRPTSFQPFFAFLVLFLNHSNLRNFRTRQIAPPKKIRYKIIQANRIIPFWWRAKKVTLPSELKTDKKLISFSSRHCQDGLSERGRTKINRRSQAWATPSPESIIVIQHLQSHWEHLERSLSKKKYKKYWLAEAK